MLIHPLPSRIIDQAQFSAYGKTREQWRKLSNYSTDTAVIFNLTPKKTDGPTHLIAMNSIIADINRALRGKYINFRISKLPRGSFDELHANLQSSIIDLYIELGKMESTEIQKFRAKLKGRYDFHPASNFYELKLILLYTLREIRKLPIDDQVASDRDTGERDSDSEVLQENDAKREEEEESGDRTDLLEFSGDDDTEEISLEGEFDNDESGNRSRVIDEEGDLSATTTDDNDNNMGTGRTFGDVYKDILERIRKREVGFRSIASGDIETAVKAILAKIRSSKTIKAGVIVKQVTVPMGISEDSAMGKSVLNDVQDLNKVIDEYNKSIVK